MFTEKVLSFELLYISHTVIVCFTDRLLTHTSPEHLIPSYYKSVRSYTKSSVKKGHEREHSGRFLSGCFTREKGRDLTQSYDKSPYTDRKSKKQRDNTKTPPTTSITQRLQTDLGRSVGVKNTKRDNIFTTHASNSIRSRGKVATGMACKKEMLTLPGHLDFTRNICILWFPSVSMRIFMIRLECPF